jgi:hypothetical protein
VLIFLFFLDYQTNELLTEKELDEYRLIVKSLVISGCDPAIESDYHGSVAQHSLWNKVVKMETYDVTVTHLNEKIL